MGHAERRLKLVWPARGATDAEAVTTTQLVAWAAQIQTEAQWRALLSNADSDATRAELERVLGPHLWFRRPAVCHTELCESGQPAIWQAVFLLHCTGGSVVHAPLDLDRDGRAIRFCETCKEEAHLQDLLLDDVWNQILAQCLAAGENPRRHQTDLIWDRVH